MDIIDTRNIKKEVFYDISSKNDEQNLHLLQTVPIMANNNEFLQHDVENCIEIESTNIINLTDNQIVKIQFQNDDGIVNTTEYIVNNDDILELNSNFLNVKQDDVFYESPILYDSTTNASSSDDLNQPDNGQDNIDITLLSPQSDNDDLQQQQLNNNLETDLTSLNWLHNITNIMAVPNLPTPPVSPKPPKKKQNQQHREDLTININFYKKNGDKKPPFSYATLICMAMGKNGNKMTLSAIYHWIRENFLYYRRAHPSWQVNCVQISHI